MQLWCCPFAISGYSEHSEVVLCGIVGVLGCLVWHSRCARCRYLCAHLRVIPLLVFIDWYTFFCQLQGQFKNGVYPVVIQCQVEEDGGSLSSGVLVSLVHLLPCQFDVHVVVVVVVVDPTPPTCCQQSPAPESCGSQQSLPPGGKERLHFVGIRPEVQARKGGW